MFSVHQPRSKSYQIIYTFTTDVMTVPSNTRQELPAGYIVIAGKARTHLFSVRLRTKRKLSYSGVYVDSSIIEDKEDF